MEYVKERVRVGVVGLGHRGIGMTEMLLDMPDVDVIAVCDVNERRLKKGVEAVRKSRGTQAMATADYREILKRGDLDALMVFTSWEMHARIATAGLRAGLYVGTEVSGGASVSELWNMVWASEETGMPCMLLENVNYSREGLALIRMVREGLFGELIHCSAGYQHDLRDEIGLGREIEHYRFDHFRLRNGELYPTHGLGPMAKILDINRGNRFMTLTSTATKARGMEDYYRNSRKATNEWVIDSLDEYEGIMPDQLDDYDMIGKPFNQGDVVTTTIKCARGETISLIHDCTLARPRLSNMRVQGTGGIWSDDADKIYFNGISPDPHGWEEAGPYFDKYDHPLWLEHQKDLGKGGHGGIDYITMRGFIDAVKRQVQTPIDVYDTASWMAVTCLSEESIALGSHPVAFPDFTSGRWVNREPVVPGKYALDKVHEEYFE